MDKFNFFKDKDKKDCEDCFIICSKKALCELLCDKCDEKYNCHDKKYNYDDCHNEWVEDQWDDNNWDNKDCCKNDRHCDNHNGCEHNPKECCEKKCCEKDKYFDKF